MMSGNQAGVGLRYLGGPTALLELGGLRLLTDPTFDPPGDYPVGSRVLRKTIGALVTPDQVGPVDAVLLSHDQHPATSTARDAATWVRCRWCCPPPPRSSGSAARSGHWKTGSTWSCPALAARR